MAPRKTRLVHPEKKEMGQGHNCLEIIERFFKLNCASLRSLLFDYWLDDCKKLGISELVHVFPCTVLCTVCICVLLWLVAGGWLIILCVKDVLAQSDCCSSVALLFSRSPQAKWDVVGRKKGSKPYISPLPPTIPPFIPQSPAAHTIQSWAARYKVSPWTISVLEPSPGLTQESSQCQYDLVNISFCISQVLPCFTGLQLCTSSSF